MKSFQNDINILITKNRKSQCLLCKMKHISVSRYPNYGLRNADAYLLVYDVTSASSFNYIQLMRYEENLEINLSRFMKDIN